MDISSSPSPLSLTGARWTLTEARQTAAVRVRTGLSPASATIFAARFGEEADARLLHPSLDDLLPPSLMLNMDRAVQRLRRAIADRELIRIITDYDVDGTTSSLILQAALRLAGHPPDRIDYHIPHRFTEGYGFSVDAAQRALEAGVGLIITADIGVRDHAAVRVAREGGADVLVCDHHLPAGESVPPDAIVLCPPQEGCDYPNPSLAACGVSLKVAQALLEGHPRFKPMLLSLIKLAAIGTVADMVPLITRENRAIVTLGLAELNRGPHAPGLAALLEVSGLKGKTITASDLGFRVGPRINAAGRLAGANLVVDLLHERDEVRAKAMAIELNALNTERQGIQRRLTQLALASATEERGLFAVIGGTEEDGWHRGVVGIVASRVKDQLGLPTAVFAVQGDRAVGSVRSITAIHAVDALESVRDLLVKFGGHAGAAGFTVPTDKLEELRARLHRYVAEHSTAEDRVVVRRADVAINPEDLSEDLVDELDRLGPFGIGNPRPRLLLRGVRPAAVELRAQGRLLKASLPTGRGAPVELVWWEHPEHEQTFRSEALDLLGHLQVNVFNGRRLLQLSLDDARKA
ncbi:MAG: single-stranded-DNA-specific exonuclease RecJ [Deltaproteobacteria bacterium]|nr:single-stranded-DNA-specific exonuclease RecJ [Deltaproteobacteria bacterium]